MKKILVTTPFFYPHIGGSERYMENLYVFLKQKHPEISIDVLCYNTDKVKEKEFYKGLNIYRIPAWNVLPGQFALPKPLSLLSFLIKHKDYNLIHTSTRFFDSSWWAPLYAKLTGTRVVLTDHCAYHPTSNNTVIDSIVRIVEATIVRFSLNFYNQIFVQNKKTGEFLKKNFGVNSKLAYPGLSKRSTAKAKTGNKKTRVIYIGRLIESKGVKDLIKTAKGFKEADFIFAGEGSLLVEFKKEAKNLDNVKILGGVSQNEVMKLLKSSDIFAYPSRHSEGLPMALVEAGQEGLAVVATDSGAIDELIKEGQTGILVQKNDFKAFRQALERLLKDSNLREMLGRNLQKFTLQNFSWDKASDLILQNLK